MRVKLHLSIWRATNGFVLQVDHAPRMIFFCKEDLLKELEKVLEHIPEEKIPAEIPIEWLKPESVKAVEDDE